MPPRKPPPGKEPESEPDEPVIQDRVRTAKYNKMETSVQGFYIMLGGALSVVPNEVAGQQFKRIGKSFALHSDEIAEAWIDLAEDDVRVRRIIESVTGFSTWGKVVGRHLEAIGDETPAIQGLRQTQQQQPPPQPTSSDVQAAAAMAQFLAETAAAQRAAQQPPSAQEPLQQPMSTDQAAEAMATFLAQQGNGGEAPQQTRSRADTIRQTLQQRRPMRQQQQQPVAQPPQHPMGTGHPEPIPSNQAPPMGQTRKPVGMPTPADLGVVIPDTPEDFPAGGSEDVRG